MKKLSFEKMSQINGGKMFGYSQSCTACYQGSAICDTTYTIFWINFESRGENRSC